MGDYIAVFDIGKTNKKFTVFDEDLRAVYTVSTKIGEKKIGDILCDDVEAIAGWVKKTFSDAVEKFDIGVIVVTTFGATVALLDERGELAFPVVSYNHEISRRTREKFFEEFGSPEELYVRTGTPPLGGLLNVGLQLFWLREEHPEVYEKVKSVLFLPNYLSYVLCGEKCVEITSIGCHTYLYDLIDNDWSTVAKGLDVPSKSPPIRDVWEAVGEARGVKVTTGIHDSNASLVPFLLTEKERFVLASTGTWCVLMYPGEPYSPQREYVYRDILYYIDVYGRPVKSARFKCGFEFDYYTELIANRFNVDPLKIPFDEETAVRVLREKKTFVIPTLAPGTGQFPRSKGRIVNEREFFKDPKTAYHVLNLSLAVQTRIALELLAGNLKGLRVLVQGGFAKNIHYLKFLATLMPDSHIIYYKYTEATSLGAALTGKAALEECKLNELDVDLSWLGGMKVEGFSVDDRYILEYLEHFERLCTQET